MIARILLFIVVFVLAKPLLKAQTDSTNSSNPIWVEIVEPPSIPDTKVLRDIDEPDPTKFVPGAKQPKEINLSEVQKLIGYPEAALAMNLQGNIVFRVLVDEEGNYAKHLPPKSGHPFFIKAVEEHINKVKFTPAILGDKPIKFWVNVPFVFRLPYTKPETKKE